MTAPAGPAASATRALAALYAPPAQQPLCTALCALEEEIGASLKPGLEHQVAHARLAWWREECARCAASKPVHPLTRAIAAAFAGRDPRSLEGLAGLVDVAEWDLAGATFATRRELTGYCERWAAAMVVPPAQLGAPTVDSSLPRALGARLRESELLASLAREARAGRLRLPLDELGAAGVEAASFPPPPWPPALAALLAARHRQLRAELSAGVAALTASAQPALRALLVWAVLAHLGSQRAEQRLPAALPSGDHHAPLDGWRAWRAARRADSGRLAL
jgi:15-cis-phytoene synthase